MLIIGVWGWGAGEGDTIVMWGGGVGDTSGSGWALGSTPGYKGIILSSTHRHLGRVILQTLFYFLCWCIFYKSHE